MMPGQTYNPRELQACVASRILQDNQSVFVGTGLPMIASMLAQRRHAPGLLIVFEAGGIGPIPPVLPISVGDSRTFFRAVSATSMHDTMALTQAGYLDYGFLGAAQIDRYGNINTTSIGKWERPKVRFPGSGGANDLGSLCQRTIMIMSQDERRFVEKVEFLTTPGYLSGPGAREKAGLPIGSGPHRVITQLGVYGFDRTSKRMTLLALHPNIKLDDALTSTSFEIIVSDSLYENDPPTAEELKILRELDPMQISTGG